MISALGEWVHVAKAGPAPYILDDYHVGLLTLLLVILLCISAVFALIGLIFQGFSVYTLAKRRGYCGVKIAFAPVIGNQVLGSIYDDICRYENKKTSQQRWLVLWSALSTVLWAMWLSAFLVFLLGGRLLAYSQGYVKQYIVPLLILLVIAIVARTIFSAARYSVLQKIFKDYEPENAILFTVLAVFFGFLIPYLLFSIRGKISFSIARAQFVMKRE